MKNLQLTAFLLFTACAFCLPAQAQKKWTYKADNGMTGNPREVREEITIIITQGPNGYEVSGEYIRGDSSCKIRGSYLPAGQRLRARGKCPFTWGVDLEITGFKLSGKDAFQLRTNVGGELVAKRVGVKPKPPSGPTTTDQSACGTWDWNRQGGQLTTATFFADRTATIKNGGPCDSQGTGTWSEKDGKVTVKWKWCNNRTSEDVMTLSADGKTLIGSCGVVGRCSSHRKASCK